MASAIPARQAWTYADLDAVPDDENSYDIIEGKLVMRNVPDANHGVVLMELIDFFLEAQRAGYGEVFTTSSAVALDYPARGDDAVYVAHPDIFFLRPERADTLRGIRAWEGVPDLVVEILSPTTLRDHRPGGTWYDAYERHGVPAYWLTEPIQRRIYQYALQGKAYLGGRYGNPVTLGLGDVLTSDLFPTVARPVDRIFQRVRERTDNRSR